MTNFDHEGPKLTFAFDETSLVGSLVVTFLVNSQRPLEVTVRWKGHALRNRICEILG